MLKIDNICTYYGGKSGVLKAVDGVTLEIGQGEILGLVGESGCGKSTLARTIMQLVPPTSGRILLEGQDLAKYSAKEVRRVRPRFQMIFQDPYASLNPRMSIHATLAEAVRAGAPELSKEAVSERIGGLLERVGLPAEAARRYPHEFSGGQRQRIAIARAIAPGPKLLIADEPVSALDVSIQAQILGLLGAIVRELGVSLLFISHDLAVVRYLCPKVAVMYMGKIVEYGETKTVIDQPVHPYTKALISAVPSGVPEERSGRILLKGEPPSPLNPPAGCAFHPRCAYAVEQCAAAVPELAVPEVAKGQEWLVRCIRRDDDEIKEE